MLAKLKRRMESNEGFTLIELLIVLVIIGILIGIAVPSYLGFKDRAADRAAQSNVRAAVPAIEACFSDNEAYTPCTVSLLKATYDTGLADTGDHAVAVHLSATDYCLYAQGRTGKWFKRAGPGATITDSATAPTGVACT